MEIYLVGGAVRDALLGKAVCDRDYTVVGSTPEQMIELGFKQVGADFPVFLHPETGDEYALARTERKSGTGYHGFDVNFSETVTLEEDLFRRDLTVNSMALSRTEELIDPFGGREDLANKVFRHTSEAFREDPLRVLRVARFMARHAHEGWVVADETLQMMTEIGRSGELQSLTPERVWKELSRALLEPTPTAFIQTLRDCEALKDVLPEVDCLFGVKQPKEHHPEIDTGIHTMMVMEQAARLSDRLEVRFGAMVHDLGKGTTPKKELPHHFCHEHRGVEIVESLADRLRTPSSVRIAGIQASNYHLKIHTSLGMNAKTLVKMFDELGYKNKPHQLEDLLLVSEADARGRTGFENRRYPQANFLRKLAASTQDIDTTAIAKQFQGRGDKIEKAIYDARVSAAKNALRVYKQQNDADSPSMC